ncbi:conserved hypothetical protein [Leishmania mexicana MHOM/GT/2001/U1103]|uniref:Uncharacterized protein n=1 Tax=Leishmania mexicana (strain MHOM/GT/2001/U1103) TaxID=929439 RepID=E9ALG2_LEIMU|nr:conserved hypothetical protein [Leishmania mexicana MHOM/GT/2001/U1103]CBZ23766.1 conserved hypothetical protein [Leishmania mexicana MHOM/GT/2001/U1103]
MSCQVGQNNWIFTDSPVCYVTPNLRLHQCTCPLTTCTPTAAGYGCHMTSSVMILSGVLVAVWIMAACAYVYVLNFVGELELEARTEKVVSLSRNYYYHKLFGTGSPMLPSSVYVPDRKLHSE